MSWATSLRAGVVPRIQHLRRVNPATIRLASTSSSPPTLVQPNVVSTTPAPSSQSANQPPSTSIKEDLKQSLRQTAGLSEGAPVEDGLRILIFGKPGSGKGTLSARLVQKYDLHFVSTGDVLRREIMNKTKVGREAEAIVSSGGLVSDELMLEIIQTELDKLRGKSWILDGFPRTLRQAGLLDSALNEQGRPLNMIIHLAVPDTVIMKRVSGEHQYSSLFPLSTRGPSRWVHLPSGRVYNTQFQSSAPKVPGLDDETGEPLTRRPDDKPETFQRRLKAFYESTSPLLDYFADHHPESLHELAGATSDEVRRASSSPTPFSYNANPQGQDLTLTLAAAPSDNIAGVEKIWPQLEALIDPYGIQRDRIRPVDEEEIKHTREVADDLRDDKPGSL
ncbi:hypothetical protein QFC22_003841 [Naganishia vaughanmartiniae]|uniref:Uncharacterized protein n=1 Tax=Naganishia vaughanmartiniae TaxID=1424756 RepID=A0ACC2X5D1_9TREE|nr:hypothetical protein QFC22_003841 [Naganishia vaughanmartiniae]